MGLETYREKRTVTAEGVEKPSRAARKPVQQRSEASSVEVAGVRLTNPQRILYPEQGLSKEALAHYYDRIADWIVPHLRHRPLTLVRCPGGHKRGCFYQKHLTEGLPQGVHAVTVREPDGEASYPLIEDRRGLIGLVQLGVLELHAWGSREDRPDRPDLLVFDLDPGPGVAWEAVIEGAHLLHELLSGLGLTSFVKTSGGKGLHILAPIVRRQSWDELRAFSRAVAESLTQAAPERFVATMSKTRRKGKIFVDYLRNSWGATAVAPYSTRARAGAPVSAPLSWEELTPAITTFTVENLPERLKADPWPGFFDLRQSITTAMRRKLRF